MILLFFQISKHKKYSTMKIYNLYFFYCWASARRGSKTSRAPAERGSNVPPAVSVPRLLLLLVGTRCPGWPPTPTPTPAPLPHPQDQLQPINTLNIHHTTPTLTTRLQPQPQPQPQTTPTQPQHQPQPQHQLQP